MFSNYMNGGSLFPTLGENTDGQSIDFPSFSSPILFPNGNNLVNQTNIGFMGPSSTRKHFEFTLVVPPLETIPTGEQKALYQTMYCQRPISSTFPIPVSSVTACVPNPATEELNSLTFSPKTNLTDMFSSRNKNQCNNLNSLNFSVHPPTMAYRENKADLHYFMQPSELEKTHVYGSEISFLQCENQEKKTQSKYREISNNSTSLINLNTSHVTHKNIEILNQIPCWEFIGANNIPKREIESCGKSPMNRLNCDLNENHLHQFQERTAKDIFNLSEKRYVTSTLLTKPMANFQETPQQEYDQTGQKLISTAKFIEGSDILQKNTQARRTGCETLLEDLLFEEPCISSLQHYNISPENTNFFSASSIPENLETINLLHSPKDNKYNVNQSSEWWCQPMTSAFDFDPSWESESLSTMSCSAPSAEENSQIPFSHDEYSTFGDVLQQNFQSYIPNQLNTALSLGSTLSRTENAKRERYVCLQCGLQLARQASLNRHMRMHSSDRRYICEHCSRRFVRKHDYTRHQRVHTKERPFACTRCKKGFSRNDALVRHLRVEGECVGTE